MRILVVEDDKKTSSYLRSALRAEAYAVDVAKEGDHGSYLARTNDYDLLIVDSALPNKSGEQICSEVRNAGKHMPILILSLDAGIEKKVAVLESGADDYMIKPFEFRELQARLRALLRRPKITIKETFRVGNLELDSASQVVTYRGSPITLTRKEFSLLRFLMQHQDEMVSRSLILEHVWGLETDVFSNTVESHICNLRLKIGPSGKKLIQNIPGRGYKISLTTDY